jgi:hypothetical protein
MNVNQEDSTQEEKKRQLFLQKRLRVKNLSVLLARRIARVVEWTGLENQRTARYRGFESLILRQKKESCLARLFFCFCGDGMRTLVCAGVRLRTKIIGLIRSGMGR